MSQLRFIDVNVAFDVRHRGDHQQVQALNHLSLELPRGKTLAIVGESGSGKSVMVAAITRTLTKRATVTGQIQHFADEDAMPVDLLAISDQEVRRGYLGRELGIIPQQVSAHLTPTRSIGSQIHETIKAIGKPGVKARDILDHLFGVCDMDPAWMKRYPHELSGGQAQRVGLVLALIGDPQVLIADEPTAGLDPDRVGSFLELIKTQRDQGRSSLIITHDVDAARDVADVVGVLLHGHLVEFGPADKVLDTPAHPWTQQLLAALPSGGLVPPDGLALDGDCTPEGATVIRDLGGFPRWQPDPTIPDWTVLGASYALGGNG